MHTTEEENQILEENRKLIVALELQLGQMKDRCIKRMKPIPIEANKLYKTRNGNYVYIYGKSPWYNTGMCKVYGGFYSSGSVGSWHSDGKSIFDNPSGKRSDRPEHYNDYDIVQEVTGAGIKCI